jgi:hypothetical protein
MRVTIDVDKSLIKPVKNQAEILQAVKGRYPDLILSPADKILFLVYEKIKGKGE